MKGQKLTDNIKYFQNFWKPKNTRNNFSKNSANFRKFFRKFKKISKKKDFFREILKS